MIGRQVLPDISLISFASTITFIERKPAGMD